MTVFLNAPTRVRNPRSSLGVALANNIGASRSSNASSAMVAAIYVLARLPKAFDAVSTSEAAWV